jgi:enolase
MSAHPGYRDAHIPPGWTKPDIVRTLAEHLDRTTVYRYLAGNHPRTPPAYVLDAFAKAMPCFSIVGLRETAGAVVAEEEPWVQPFDANRLSHTQRAAPEVFIRPTVQAAMGHPADLTQQGGSVDQIRTYVAQLRRTGQDELADRLEASLATTSSASHTASKSSRD